MRQGALLCAMCCVSCEETKNRASCHCPPPLHPIPFFCFPPCIGPAAREGDLLLVSLAGGWQRPFVHFGADVAVQGPLTRVRKGVRWNARPGAQLAVLPCLAWRRNSCSWFSRRSMSPISALGSTSAAPASDRVALPPWPSTKDTARATGCCCCTSPPAQPPTPKDAVASPDTSRTARSRVTGDLLFRVDKVDSTAGCAEARSSSSAAWYRTSRPRRALSLVLDGEA